MDPATCDTSGSTQLHVIPLGPATCDTSGSTQLHVIPLDPVTCDTSGSTQLHVIPLDQVTYDTSRSYPIWHSLILMIPKDESDWCPPSPPPPPPSASAPGPSWTPPLLLPPPHNRCRTLTDLTPGNILFKVRGTAHSKHDNRPPTCDMHTIDLM